MEIQGYTMPLDLYYEENHYWVKIDGNEIVIGMDDFAQQLAGEIVFVQLPSEGKKLKKGLKRSLRWKKRFRGRVKRKKLRGTFF